MPRLMTYNIEWFDELVRPDNTLADGDTAQARLAAVAEVIRLADPDLIGMTEAPNTKADGSKSTVTALERFADAFGLRCSKALLGFPSDGRQEIALLYDPTVFTAHHDPGGRASSRVNPPFDQEFLVDSDVDGIDEVYRHYRPPLEARVTRTDGGPAFWLMVVHAKSKAIYDAMDRAHFNRVSERNRRKLFAECTSIRRRVDEWQRADRPVVVMGDVNDGPGFDYYEGRFGRSAMELIMGDIFDYEGILVNRVGQPKWGRFGWEPSTARFTDPFTGDLVNALIDHVVASPALAPPDQPRARVWNPWQDKALKALPEDERNALRTTFRLASDHMPVTLDIV